MAEIAGWFTMNGRHIPYMVGQSKAEAAQKYMSSKHGKEVSRLTSKSSSKKQSINKKLEEYRNMNEEELYQLRSKLFSQKSSEIFNEGLNGSSEYQKLVRELGLNDKPTILSEKEFNTKLKDNELIYRGVKGTTKWDGKDYIVDRSGEDIINNLKYGNKTYIGDGVYGDGIYFTNSRVAAREYSGLNDKAMATAFLDKSKMNAISFKDLDTSYKEFLKDNPKFDPYGVTADISLFAMYKGYNVIIVDKKETHGKRNLL